METIKEDEWIEKFRDITWSSDIPYESEANYLTAKACFEIAKQYAASIQGSSAEVLTEEITEELAEKVREVWVSYCKETGDKKPSHIAPYRTLSEWDKEADRRIGKELFKLGYAASIQDNSAGVSMQDEANKYAERVCNGQFPITYTRKQVVKHTAGDYEAGANRYRQHVLSILNENYKACKNLVDEDKARSAQEMVNETYEDLISIFSNNSASIQGSKVEIKMADLLMDFLRFHYRENPCRKYATNEKEVYKFLEENPKWQKAHQQK